VVQALILELFRHGGYYQRLTMDRSLQLRVRGISAILRLMACLASVVMLVTLSAPRGHQVADHFRFPEIRRAVEQHTFVDKSKIDAYESISANYVRPSSLFQIDTDLGVKPSRDLTPVPTVPISRLLLRIKLGPSRSSTPDPLL
jgi:hypothetical protein